MVVANYATYDFLQISWCAWIWLLYINLILLKKLYTCTLYDDACLKYLISLKTLLVFANLCNLWFLQIHLCARFWLMYNPILLKVEIVVRFTMLRVWNTWFFQITTGSCKFMQIATLQIYLCYSFDWYTDSILLKIKIHHISGEVQILKINSRRLCEITLTLSPSNFIYMFCIYMPWL